jgi:cytochrome c oxidase subunit 2
MPAESTSGNADPSEEFGEPSTSLVSRRPCLNQKDLREWLRNAPEKKPMYADPDQCCTETDGKYRGMPATWPSQKIRSTQSIAYLLELK